MAHRGGVWPRWHPPPPHPTYFYFHWRALDRSCAKLHGILWVPWEGLRSVLLRNLRLTKGRRYSKYVFNEGETPSTHNTSQYLADIHDTFAASPIIPTTKTWMHFSFCEATRPRNLNWMKQVSDNEQYDNGHATLWPLAPYSNSVWWWDWISSSLAAVNEWIPAVINTALSSGDPWEKWPIWVKSNSLKRTAVSNYYVKRSKYFSHKTPSLTGCRIF